MQMPGEIIFNVILVRCATDLLRRTIFLILRIFRFKKNLASRHRAVCPFYLYSYERHIVLTSCILTSSI